MKFLSLDVECAKAGNEYIPIWIAVVSDQLEVLLDSYVKPSCKISSWLSNLHGIEEKHVDSAPSIDQVLADLRKILSSDCILVGQSIASDVAYLNLKQGTDFAECVDVALFFALTPQEIAGEVDASCTNPPHHDDGYNCLRSPRRFTLQQSVKYLLSENFCAHNPVEDAKYAMRLYLKYKDSPELREEAKNILRESVYPRKTQVPSSGKSKNSNSHKQPVSSLPSNPKANPQYPPNDKKGYSRTRTVAPKFINPIMQPIHSSPQKVVSFVGKLEILISRIKLIGRPSVTHLFMVQSPEALLMQRPNSLESINYFNYVKVQDVSLMNQGFWRGAFQGPANSIDFAINSLQYVNSKSSSSVVAITLQLCPLDSFLFYEEDKDLIVTVHNMPESERIFVERVNKILSQYPDLKLSKTSKEHINGIEFEKWMELIEAKMKLIDLQAQAEKVKDSKLFQNTSLLEQEQISVVLRKSPFLEGHATKLLPNFPQYLPFPVPPMGPLPFVIPPMPLHFNSAPPIPMFYQGLPSPLMPPFLVPPPLHQSFS